MIFFLNGLIYKSLKFKLFSYRKPAGDRRSLAARSLDCKPPVRISIRPVADSNDYVRMNVLSSWDTDFEKVPCVSQSARDVCNKVAFVSQDPRLVSSAHSGQRLALDNIPLNGKVQVVYNLATERLATFGRRRACGRNLLQQI